MSTTEKDNVGNGVESCGKHREEKANYIDESNEFYDLATDTFESGWGESIHLAPRYEGETLRESIKRHEHFFALQLGLRPGQKVLDVGCGIGGPAREIARFSYTKIIGININEYQINRAKSLTNMAGLEHSCEYVIADFMKIPFPENYFDAVYAIEATYHAPDLVACYKEIYRVLKPGQLFAVDEWCMTDAFDSNNQQHLNLKADLQLIFGFDDMRLQSQCLQAFKMAGFQVVFEKDRGDSPVPWYAEFGQSVYAEKNNGGDKVEQLLDKGNAALFAAGSEGIFTPKYFLLGRKPPLNE